MKKPLLIVLTLAMLLSLCACGGGNENESSGISTENGTNDISTENETNSKDSKSREVLGLEVCIDLLKDNLKNPSSLEIHNVRCVPHDKAIAIYYYEIDYSAENSFGGATRDTIYVSTTVYFPTETKEARAEIDKTYLTGIEIGGLTHASVSAEESFNEQTSTILTLDTETIQEAME